MIEDAAQSFGASYKGRRSGGLSTIGCTSFFPSKPLGCYGDGGACFTDDPALGRKMAQIRLHGQERATCIRVIGMNGRLDTLQAAILLAKLDAFPQEVAQRAVDGSRYLQLIEQAELSEVTTIALLEGNDSVYAQFTIRVGHRDRVVTALKNAGVPTAVHYPICLHRQPVYASAGMDRLRFEHAEKAATEVLSLPMYPGIEDRLQQYVVDQLALAMNAAQAI